MLFEEGAGDGVEGGGYLRRGLVMELRVEAI